jgi:predicted metal-dependent hydrolase
MSFKKFEIADIGTVSVYKRRGARSMKLSITATGEIRVSLPYWAPYRLGLEFVKSKHGWIATMRQPTQLLRQHDRIGKTHTLAFMPASGSRISTRLAGAEIRVLIPHSIDIADSRIQTAARKACVRALRQEAEQLLPGRLQLLARQHGFNYRSVNIKQLKSRWGSCNERTDIMLNCFLMQLPWELIDYVLLHELVHTRIMAHGPRFWTELAKYVDNLPAKRKQIKSHKPALLIQ